MKGRSNSPADDSVAIQNYGRLNAAPSKIRMGQAHSKRHNGKKITPYAWIYRWESEQEFVLKPEDQQLHILVETLTMDLTKPTHKYLKNITESRPYICIYHKVGPSKMKNCSDIDHFHMISWHHDHPTCEYSFGALKKALNDRGERSYNMTCPKVYSPYGLC